MPYSWLTDGGETILAKCWWKCYVFLFWVALMNQIHPLSIFNLFFRLWPLLLLRGVPPPPGFLPLPFTLHLTSHSWPRAPMLQMRKNTLQGILGKFNATRLKDRSRAATALKLANGGRDMTVSTPPQEKEQRSSKDSFRKDWIFVSIFSCKVSLCR